MKITSKDLRRIIKEEFEAVMAEQEKQANFPSHDAVKAAIEKGQIDVGKEFTFMLGNNVRKGVYVGKRKVAAKGMPDDSSVFFINRSGDITSMRKKDMGSAAELDKKYRDPEGPVAQGLEPYTLSDNPK